MPMAMWLLLLLYVVPRNSHRTLATVAVIAVAVRRMKLPCNRTQRILKLRTSTSGFFCISSGIPPPKMKINESCNVNPKRLREVNCRAIYTSSIDFFYYFFLFFFILSSPLLDKTMLAYEGEERDVSVVDHDEKFDL